MTDHKMITTLTNSEQNMDEKSEAAYAAYSQTVKLIKANIDDDNERHQEIDFVLSLVMNLMINRHYCLDCFMTRMMEIVDKLEKTNAFFVHSSEEEKQKMN